MKHPEEIRNVSQSIFSIARYSGGCTIQGRSYFYNPVTDTLVRDDILRARQKEGRDAKKKSAKETKKKQGKLL